MNPLHRGTVITVIAGMVAIIFLPLWMLSADTQLINLQGVIGWLAFLLLYDTAS